ncbi:hypothetical protein [Halalkalibacter urbisdiaboli]|nr:hypothetical protein [Halalkalibacter urbisdiaboli]
MTKENKSNRKQKKGSAIEQWQEDPFRKEAIEKNNIKDFDRAWEDDRL